MRGVRPVALTEAGRTKGSSMKNTGKRNEPWITVDEGILEGSTETVEKKKKIYGCRQVSNPGTYTCTAKQPHTYRWPGMPGNFSMAPAELEFSLIFTFSRHPPRGSAIVRAASLRPPTTITEKMQRTAAEYTYLPTLTTQRREAVDSNTLQ